MTLNSWASLSASALSLFGLSLLQSVQDQTSLRFYSKGARLLEGEAFWETLSQLPRSRRVESACVCVC